MKHLNIKLNFNFEIIISEQKTLIQGACTPEDSWDLAHSRLFDPSFMRIWIILSGHGHVKTIFGEFDVSENNAYFLPKNTIISTEVNGTMKQFYIDFIQSPREIPIDNLYEFNYAADKKHLDIIFSLSKMLSETNKKNDFASSITISSGLTTILSFFIKSKKLSANKLTDAINYISEHYNKPISIVYLANLCNYSPEYFSMIFKKTFKQSPHEYIINIRIMQAKKYLIQTNLSIREIGEQVGYPDVFHFSKVFTKFVGVSPQKYRISFLKNKMGF